MKTYSYSLFYAEMKNEFLKNEEKESYPKITKFLLNVPFSAPKRFSFKFLKKIKYFFPKNSRILKNICLFTYRNISYKSLNVSQVTLNIY